MTSNNNNRKLTLKKNDECYTPDKVWDDIKTYMPTSGTVYEPFFGQGHTFRWLKKSKLFEHILGQQGLDFFSPQGQRLLKECDCVVTNPPFSIKFKILKQLVDNDKPFILLFPMGSINTLTFTKIFGKKKINNVSIIIPHGRIKFIVNNTLAKSPSFETIYLCYKIKNIKSNLVFLN